MHNRRKLCFFLKMFNRFFSLLNLIFLLCTLTCDACATVPSQKSFSLSAIALSKKPLEIEMRLLPYTRTARARGAIYANGKCLYEGPLDSCVGFLRPLLPKKQIVTQKGILDIEKDLQSFIADSDRKLFVDALFKTFFKARLPNMGDQRGTFLKNIFPPHVRNPENEQTALGGGQDRLKHAAKNTFIFGAWQDEEQEKTTKDATAKLTGLPLSNKNGFLKAPLAPRSIVSSEGDIQGGWLYTRGQGMDVSDNVAAMTLKPGHINVTDPEDNNVLVPFVLRLEEKKGAPLRAVARVAFLWIRGLACLGENDLKGPLGKQVSSLAFLGQLKKNETEDSLTRFHTAKKTTWITKPNHADKSLFVALKKILQAQHVVSAFDINLVSAVIKKSKDAQEKPATAKQTSSTSNLYVLEATGVGKNNQDGPWTFCRHYTHIASAFMPCPLRYANGVRLLLAHQLPTRVRESLLSHKNDAEK